MTRRSPLARWWLFLVLAWTKRPTEVRGRRSLPLSKFQPRENP